MLAHSLLVNVQEFCCRRNCRSEEENSGEKREIPMGKMIYCEIFEKKVEKSLEVIKNCVSLQSV